MLEQTTIPFDTRQAAHARIASTKQEVCTRVLRFAFERGAFGIIPDEVSEAFECDHNQTCLRISELKKRGLLVDTGRTSPTHSGSPAAVVVHFEFARTDDRTEVTVAEKARMHGQGKAEARG